MEKPIKENFKVTKVKLANDGGLDCHYEIVEQVNGEYFIEQYHTKSAKDVHPDLIAKFNKMKPIVAQVFHLIDFAELISMDDFGADEDQMGLVTDLTERMLARIEPIGISIIGKKGDEGVTISSAFYGDSLSPMAINTHRIKVTENYYEFEEELRSILEAIRDECYQFLFENKQAELSEFGVF